MPKKVNENIQQSLLDKGLKLIVSAFNEQKKEFSKTIFEQEIEIKKLKEENNVYKKKLSALHKKLYTISKTFCEIDIDTEETKDQIEENHNKSLQKEFSTLNNIYHKKNKNDSFNNQKPILYKNHKSSFQEEKKSSLFSNRIKPRREQNNKNSSISHHNLKYYLFNNNNRDYNNYNKYIGNLNYLKKRKYTNDTKEYGESDNNYNNNNNSYFIESPKEIIVNNYEESKTDRDCLHNRNFSEKFLNIKVNNNKKENNNEISEILDNNNISFNNGNNNDLKINNINNNENDIEGKNGKYEDNLSSKITNEDEYLKESKEQSNSSIYNKLNAFLEKCKLKLNALDYEKIIKILKYYENDSNIDIKQKIKKIINNNNKLCKLFDDIFESS